MIGIYKIENLVNHKVYIGQTVNYTRRVYLHTLYLSTNRHKNDHLQKAWNKYGSENFKFELFIDFTDEFVAYDRSTQKRLLDEAERFWIKTLKAFDEEYGYNLSLGGDGATLFGDRNPSYGNHKSEETRKKISATLLERKSNAGKNNGRYGKPVSALTRQKISNANKGRKQSEEERKRRSESMRIAAKKPENIARREARKLDPERKKAYIERGIANRKYTDDFVVRLRSEYANGKSIQEISDERNLRYKLVREIVNKNGHFKNR